MLSSIGIRWLLVRAAVAGLVLLAGCGEDSLLGPGSGDGTVFINSYPDDPGFPWRLTMPSGLVLNGQGDSTLVDMPEGRYSIAWQPAQEWISPYPNPFRRTLEYPLAITFTGIYTPIAHNNPDYPVVPAVEVRHGPEAGQVEVSWLWFLSQDHPTEHYAVGMSLTGPITVDDWPGCDAVRLVEHHDDLVGYSHVFSPVDGLVPGQRAWFAVRAVDAEGWMTHVTDSPDLVVSRPWWAEGTVLAPDGQPVSGVAVGCDPGGRTAVSDEQGRYRLGPLPDQGEIFLWTDAAGCPSLTGADGWYDFRSPPYVHDGRDQVDVLVLPRYGMDDRCLTYDGDFLTYLRYMTKTDAPGLERPDQTLCSWNAYPVRVHVPAYVRPDGVDFGAEARAGIDIWNLVLGEEILVHQGVTEEQADVVFRFDDLGSMINGVTSLVEPTGHDGHLGYIVPELIAVGLNRVVLPTAQRVRETALHEMGHALGLYRHVQACSEVGYLMAITSAGVLDDGPLHAVHPDEQHAMQVVCRLPRWMDLSGFH